MRAGAKGRGGGQVSNPHIDLYLSHIPRERTPGAGSGVHTSGALSIQTLLVTFSISEALGKSSPMLLRARELKMKLEEIHFPLTMELH